MSTGLKANVDGSAAIQVGGVDAITLTSAGAASFVTSPMTIQGGSAAAPSLTFSGDTNTGIFSPAADTIAFTEGGVESMRITSAGDVGIGTTTPNKTLIGRALTINGSANAGLELAAGDSLYGLIFANSSRFSIDTNNTGANIINFYTSGAERMRIDSSGNVGVGTTSINTTLAVNGNALFGTGAWPTNDFGRSASRFVAASGTEDGFLVAVNMQSGVGTNRGGFINLGARATTGVDGATFAQIGGIRENATSGNYASALTFYTSTSGGAITERARITSAGYSKFSNDGTYAGATGVYHEFKQSANDYTLVAWGTNASTTNTVHEVYQTRSASSAYTFIQCYSNLGATPDREFQFRGDGNGYADGTFNNNGADYAEYFESANGQALTLGATVVLDNNKVREATSQDPASAIMGVVRPKEPSKASMVVGNTAWNKWANKFLTDDFDRYIMEDHNVLEWTDEDGKQHSYESHNIPDGVTVPDDAVVKTHDDKGNKFQHYKLNPAWDKDAEYTPREHRPEWNIIGLIGQVKVLKGQPVNDRWIKMRDVSDTVEEWFIR